MSQDVNDRRLLILENIDSTDVTKHLLKKLVELTGEKPPECKSDDQHWMFMFLSRFGWTSFTLWRIFFPEPNYELQPKDSKGVILDVTSGGTIVRSLYENYLAAYHLVGDAVSTEQLECRRLIWDWHAAKLKCLFVECFESAPEIADPASRDFLKLDRELKDHPVFKRIPNSAQRKILRRDSGLSHSHKNIAEAAAVDPSFHTALYGYLSGHAHCDSHSFRSYTQGDHKYMMDSLRMHFLQISGLMLDLTIKFLLTKEIQADLALKVIIEFGVKFVREFKNTRESNTDAESDQDTD